MSHRSFRVVALIGVLAAGLLVNVPVSLAATPRYVATTGDDLAGANDCTNQLAPCLTIQQAVDQSAPGDTIVVAPGTYTALPPVVNKSVTLQGANAGMDPRPGCAPPTPSIIDGGIELQANGVILDGFTIEGATVLGDFGINTDEAYSGYEIRNNVIQNNTNGLFLNGALATVEKNCFVNNDIGFPADGDDHWSIVGGNGSGDLVNVLISNNRSDNGFLVFADERMEITGNEITGALEDGIAAIASFPTTTVLINHNVVTNSGSCSCDDGIFVLAINALVNRNATTGSAGYGIESGYPFATMDGTCNWFGDPDGPGSIGADDVSPNVIFDPWLDSPDLDASCGRHASFAPASHDFGTLTVGTTSPTFTFTLTSDGTQSFHVTGVSIVGANPSQYQLGSNGCFDATLAVSQSCVVGVVFAPGAAGAQSAVLRVTSDGGASPTDATLTGVGTAPAAKGSITIVEDSLPDASRRFLYAGDLGSFVLTDPSKRQHTFSNLTPGSYEVSQLTNPAQWSLLDLSCSTAQTTNLATGTVTINLTPGANITCTFTNAFRRPDGQISLNAGGPFIGDNVYTRRARLIQTVTRENVTPGQTYSYFVLAQNDAVVADTMTIEGRYRPSSAMSVHYFVNGVDQTAAIAAGTYSTGALAPGAFQTIEIRVDVNTGATTGRTRVSLRIHSAAKPLQVDTVRATTTL